LLHFKLATAYFNLRSYFGRLEVVVARSGKPGMIHEQWYLVEVVPGKEDTFLAAPTTSAAFQIAAAIDKGLGDRADVRMLRANIYLNAGRYERAHELFSELAPDVPEESAALFHYYFAQAAFGLGDYDRYLELLQEAIDAQGEGIGIVDPEECFVFANPAAEMLFGVPSGGLVGRCVMDFVAPGYQSLVKEQTEKRRRVREINQLLRQPAKRWKLIREELAEVVEKYGDGRRTKMNAGEELAYDPTSHSTQATDETRLFRR